MAACRTGAASPDRPEGWVSLSRPRDSVVHSHCCIFGRIARRRISGARADQLRCANCRRRSGSFGAIGGGLIEQKPDVIVTVGSPAVRIMHSATTTIPIVAHDLDTDPVISGLIASLGHPGGNVTGYFLGFPEFRMKWVEVLKETIPNLTSVAVLWDPATGPSQVKAVEEAAGALGVKLQILETQRQDDIADAFATATRLNVGAVLMLSSPVLMADLKMVADLALKHKLAMVTFFGEFARAGGFMTYGPNLLDTYRQVGGMVGKVLHGVRPADLPAELPTKFELVLNLRTAKSLGLVIPQSVLLRRGDRISRRCPLLALSGHAAHTAECPLSG